jgi:hypothetical protein
MKSAVDAHIIEAYMIFLESFSPSARLKSDIKSKEDLFASSYGSWIGNETAEEIVEGIRNSGIFHEKSQHCKSNF